MVIRASSTVQIHAPLGKKYHGEGGYSDLILSFLSLLFRILIQFGMASKIVFDGNSLAELQIDYIFNIAAWNSAVSLFCL